MIPTLPNVAVYADDLDYPLIPLDRSEKLTGEAKVGRYPSRLKAAALIDHPKLKRFCDIADRRYHMGGKWIDYGLGIKENCPYDPADIWAVLNALMKSPHPNHLQRWAAVGLALYNWFDFATAEELQEIDRINQKHK